jgi:hypothetical protein
MVRGNEAILAVFEEAGFGMEEADQSGSRRCGPPLHKRYVAQPAGDIPKSRNESFEHELG